MAASRRRCSSLRMAAEAGVSSWSSSWPASSNEEWSARRGRDERLFAVEAAALGLSDGGDGRR